MKRLWLLCAILLAAWLFPTLADAQQLTIGNYTVVSSKRLSRTEFEYVYKASVSNVGEDVVNVIGTLTSGAANMTVVEGTLSFGNVAAGATAASIDTFTVRIDRTSTVPVSAFIWNISAESAAPLRARFNALPAAGDAPLRVTFVPDPITVAAINLYEWDLDGNGSFETRDTVGRNFSFTYTQPGNYPAKLRVTDSKGRQDTQTVTIAVGNAPPVVTAQAQPSNGQVPLTVNFSATATDNEGIARYEWDFQGDGVYDYSSTSSGNTSFTYTSVGVFRPVLRVTDGRGLAVTYSLPATTVRAAPPGSPTVTATASPASGNAPLTVTLSGSASDPSGHPFTRYEWDFQDDGVVDASGGSPAQTFTYVAAGSYFPRLRAVTDDGRTAEDVVQVSVQSNVTLRVSPDTIDPSLSETATITTTLIAPTKVSLIIEKRGGAGIVRTLVPFATRGAGTYTDAWDGKNDAGVVVPQGDYYAVLVYESGGVNKRLDLALSTGGVQYNPPRSAIPGSFSPFAGLPLTIDFTLSRASEVTAFMGQFYVDTRLVTFLQREPLGRGTHRIVWNGENGDGQLIQPPPGDSFLFGIWGYTFPDNAIFVRSGVQVSALRADPSILDPTGLDAAGQPERSRLTFTLSKPATIELVINDATSGNVLGRRQYPNLAAGINEIQWDGKVGSGVLVAPGRYRLGVTAIEPNGFKSLTLYTLQRVYY